MTVDWNKPIICKENGARLEVMLTDEDGDRRCQPVAPDEWPSEHRKPLWANQKGVVWGCDYTVINAPEADIPHSAKVRACELANAEAAGSTWWEATDVDEEGSIYSPLRALARYIAQHEPEPVDPDLVLAREAVAQVLELDGMTKAAARARGGEETPMVRSALRAIKLVRERGQ